MFIESQNSIFVNQNDMGVFVCVQPPEEDPQIPFHGVVFLDVGRLLYPGVTRIRGAYSIQPFSETELLNKVKQIHILKPLSISFFVVVDHSLMLWILVLIDQLVC